MQPKPDSQIAVIGVDQSAPHCGAKADHIFAAASYNLTVAQGFALSSSLSHKIAFNSEDETHFHS